MLVKENWPWSLLNVLGKYVFLALDRWLITTDSKKKLNLWLQQKWTNKRYLIGRILNLDKRWNCSFVFNVNII